MAKYTRYEHVELQVLKHFSRSKTLHGLCRYIIEYLIDFEIALLIYKKYINK